jgi:outer membrane lipoprotein-sorting protein
VSQVLLEITPDSKIARILIHGTDDSITEYRFSDQKENLAVPDGKFRFSAPAGSEVVDEQAAR